MKDTSLEKILLPPVNNRPFTYIESEFKNNLEFKETSPPTNKRLFREASLFDIKPPEAVITSENRYPFVESVLTMINSLHVTIFAYKLPFIDASVVTNKRLFIESPVETLLPPPPVNNRPFTYIESEFKNNLEFKETSPPTNKRLFKETSE